MKTNIVKKSVIAITIAVTLIAIAFMGYSYAKETQMKMEAMKYMEANWYSGINEVDNITTIKELDNGHYYVEYTSTEDGKTVVSDAELAL